MIVTRYLILYRHTENEIKQLLAIHFDLRPEQQTLQKREYELCESNKAWWIKHRESKHRKTV